LLSFSQGVMLPVHPVNENVGWLFGVARMPDVDGIKSLPIFPVEILISPPLNSFSVLLHRPSKKSIDIDDVIFSIGRILHRSISHHCYSGP
jgi:hypothetical protein